MGMARILEGALVVAMALAVGCDDGDTDAETDAGAAGSGGESAGGAGGGSTGGTGGGATGGTGGGATGGAGGEATGGAGGEATGGEGGAGGAGEPPTIVEGPTIGIANAAVPLSAVLEVESDVPTRARIQVTAGEDTWSHDFDGFATAHALPVLGLMPDLAHQVTVTLTTEARGTLTLDPVAVTTSPVPDELPPVTVTVSEPDRMEPGYTMFNIPFRNRAEGGFLVAVDAQGRYRWIYTYEERPSDARRLDNGNILFVMEGSRRGAMEVDMLGNIHARWHVDRHDDADSIPVATDSMHHEIFPLENGNLVFLSSEARTFEDWPTAPEDPTPREEPIDVIGDVVVEMNRDGEIQNEWSLLDMLDPYRLGYDSTGGFWNSYYDAEVADWSHANSVIHDTRDDTFIVSARQIDTVFKFDRGGNVVWILAPHENWVEPWTEKLLMPEGDLDWSYHTHAPQITQDGNLLLFDNGVQRASPPAQPLALEDRYSRVVEYAIDEENLTVRQVWEYDANREIYCRIVGDADEMPTTGNVLGVWGHTDPEDTEPVAFIHEVTKTTPAEVVFALQVEDHHPEEPSNRIIYRAERLADLWP